MNILITGGSGFIGSNFLINKLKNQKYNFLNFDKLTYAGNPDNLKKIEKHPNYSFIKGDICDLNLISKVILDFKPDAVIHFAAESHVDRSINSPMEFVNTNILGTANLLTCCLNYWKNIKKTFRFIHISTDEVFGSLKNVGKFTENTPYSPNSPYSASKASSDHLVRAWHKTYNFPSIITNCSNNYGPYQFPEKLIPLIVANCLDEKPLPIYGKGENIRDWLYVEDHCEGIASVLINGKLGETYNIGGNNEITNISIVQTICSILDDIRPRASNNSYQDLIKFVADRPGHDFRYAIDSSKIHNELGWKPKYTFETGIRKTIVWYLENESWWREIQKTKYAQERLGLGK